IVTYEDKRNARRVKRSINQLFIRRTYEENFINRLRNRSDSPVQLNRPGTIRSREARRERLCGLRRSKDSLRELREGTADRDDPRLSRFLVHMAGPEGGIVEGLPSP